MGQTDLNQALKEIKATILGCKPFCLLTAAYRPRPKKE